MKNADWLALLRPTQWIKNLMIFFPPFLSGSIFTSLSYTASGFFAFISFCCISSSLYVFNDILDIASDTQHPVKKFRPLASGVVHKNNAAVMVLILFVLGLAFSFMTVRSLLPYLLLYSAITILYSLWLKHIPVVDLFCISCGFLVRLQAGGSVFNVKISIWLYLCVFFLSLCLSAGKRLAEQRLLGSSADSHRASLRGYPYGTLDSILLVTSATVLVAYSMYTVSHPQLMYSVPLCTFGLFRYILRVKSGSSGDPTESLIKDIPLLFTSILWAVFVAWSIYL